MEITIRFYVLETSGWRNYLLLGWLIEATLIFWVKSWIEQHINRFFAILPLGDIENQIFLIDALTVLVIVDEKVKLSGERLFLMPVHTCIHYVLFRSHHEKVVLGQVNSDWRLLLFLRLLSAAWHWRDFEHRVAEVWELWVLSLNYQMKSNICLVLEVGDLIFLSFVGLLMYSRMLHDELTLRLIPMQNPLLLQLFRRNVVSSCQRIFLMSWQSRHFITFWFI